MKTVRDLVALKTSLLALGQKAKREGLLSIEEDIRSDSIDPMLRVALALAVDGAELGSRRQLLENRRQVTIAERNHRMEIIRQCTVAIADKSTYVRTQVPAVRVVELICESLRKGKQ